jgi:hypothetical protein
MPTRNAVLIGRRSIYSAAVACGQGPGARVCPQGSSCGSGGAQYRCQKRRHATPQNAWPLCCGVRCRPPRAARGPAARPVSSSGRVFGGTRRSRERRVVVVSGNGRHSSPPRTGALSPVEVDLGMSLRNAAMVWRLRRPLRHATYSTCSITVSASRNFTIRLSGLHSASIITAMPSLAATASCSASRLGTSITIFGRTCEASLIFSKALRVIDPSSRASSGMP